MISNNIETATYVKPSLVDTAGHAPLSATIAEIERLISELRAVAAPVGSLHAYWDIIVDLEESRACVPPDVAERVDYARKVLAARNARNAL